MQLNSDTFLMNGSTGGTEQPAALPLHRQALAGAQDAAGKNMPSAFGRELANELNKDGSAAAEVAAKPAGQVKTTDSNGTETAGTGRQRSHQVTGAGAGNDAAEGTAAISGILLDSKQGGEELISLSSGKQPATGTAAEKPVQLVSGKADAAEIPVNGKPQDTPLTQLTADRPGKPTTVDSAIPTSPDTGKRVESSVSQAGELPAQSDASAVTSAETTTIVDTTVKAGSAGFYRETSPEIGGETGPAPATSTDAVATRAGATILTQTETQAHSPGINGGREKLTQVQAAVAAALRGNGVAANQSAPADGTDPMQLATPQAQPGEVQAAATPGAEPQPGIAPTTAQTTTADSTAEQIRLLKFPPGLNPVTAAQTAQDEVDPRTGRQLDSPLLEKAHPAEKIASQPASTDRGQRPEPGLQLTDLLQSLTGKVAQPALRPVESADPRLPLAATQYTDPAVAGIEPNHEAGRDQAIQRPLSPTSDTRSLFSLPTPAANNPQWQAEVVDRVRWLNRADLSSAELQLHPEELGKIEIKISTRDDQTTVNFFTKNPQARELIEASLPRLKEILGNSGLQLEHSDVSQHSMAEGSQRQSLPEQFSSRTGSGADEFTDAAEIVMRPARQAGGLSLVDHYV